MIFDFQSEYLSPAEIVNYDLPSSSQLPNIMTLVDGASSLIDTYCGRVDANGAGSLAYTTYAERILLLDQRNQFRVAFTPIVALDTTTQASLSGLNAVSGNHFYSGFLPNSVIQLNGTLSGIIAMSGRYSTGRRSASQVYPDSQYAANILQVAAFFGGPPQFTSIDLSLTDYYDIVGEVWAPAGLFMMSYTEIIIMYNAGYDPRNMPKPIKHATAALVKNFLVRGGGITSVKGYTAGKIHTQFSENLIDKNIEQWLAPFRKVIAI